MFFYIDQPHTPSFPIGFIKTKFDFILDQLRLGDWLMGVNAGGSCD